MEKNKKTSVIETITIETSSKVEYTSSSYRGFASIDQEMEREIAVRYFSPGEKTPSKKSLFFRGWR